MKPPVLHLVFRVAVAAAAGFVAMGCEDPADDIPQAVREQQARQAAAEKNLPKIPATQELTTGPRQTIPLGPLPMTMRVPASWKVEVAGGASLLRGFSPSGEITIQLTSRPSLKQAELDALIKGAKKEQAEKPQSILKVDVRPLGNVQVYERQAVGEPAPFTVYEPAGNQIKERTTTEQMFKWTISVLAPHADALQRYELNFVGLTKSQYDKDKEFLHGLLDTMTYAGGTGGAGGATTAPAPAGGVTTGGAGSTGAGASPSPTTLP